MVNAALAWAEHSPKSKENIAESAMSLLRELTTNANVLSETELAIAKGEVKCSNAALAAKLHSERTGFNIMDSVDIVRNSL